MTDQSDADEPHRWTAAELARNTELVEAVRRALIASGPYEGPVEEARMQLAGRDLTMQFTVNSVELHGVCALVRGRLPNGSACAVFVHAHVLLALLDHV